MKQTLKFAVLQYKRYIKLMPFVLIITVLLSAVSAVLLNSLLDNRESAEGKQKLTLAITGDLSNTYLEVGIAAVQNLDLSRFAIVFITTDENTAAQMLKDGQINGYFVIPENFVENAVRGEIGKIQFVDPGNAAGLGTQITSELIHAISKMILSGQKNVYGVLDLAEENSFTITDIHKMQYDITVDYIMLIVNRDSLYKVEKTGYSGGADEVSSIAAGILSIFFMMCGIFMCPLCAKRDKALLKLLRFKGVGSVKQVLCEYAAYASVLFLIILIILLIAGIFITSFNIDNKLLDVLRFPYIFKFASELILPLLLISAVQFTLYEITDGIVSSVMLQFIFSISIGYISGCLYPIRTFPVFIQRIALYLPTGIVREHLSSYFYGYIPSYKTLILIISILLFVCAAIILRHRKLKS